MRITIPNHQDRIKYANRVCEELDFDPADWWKRDKKENTISYPGKESEKPAQDQQDKAELESTFRKLVDEWRVQTGGYSLKSRRYTHYAYHQILVLAGKNKDLVIRLILTELQTRPDWWFAALELLTEANPVLPTHNFKEAVSDWLEWGKKNSKI